MEQKEIQILDEEVVKELEMSTNNETAQFDDLKYSLEFNDNTIANKK